MSQSAHKLSITEKVGYSLGDAAANFVWRSLILLPLFYTDTFGLTAAHAAVLLLLVRLSDGITDVIMGTIADRTNTPQGKFRPWVLWSAPVLALFLVLVFTTPDMSYTAKHIYAYVVYFILTLAYTANNVPYGALMGVMTSDVKERAMLSSFRFVGAFGGGLVVMVALPELVDFFGKGDQGSGYQSTMILFAVLLVIFCTTTYKTTKERIKPVVNQTGTMKSELIDLMVNLPVILIPIAGISVFLIALSQPDWSASYKYTAAAVCAISFVFTLMLRKWLINLPKESLSHTRRDLVDLLTNKPWLILLVIGIFFGIFTVIRPSAAGFYLKNYMTQQEVSVLGFQFKTLSVYFFITLVASLVAALATGHLNKSISKRNLYAIAFGCGAIFNGAIYFVQPDQLGLMFGLAIIGEFFAGMMPVLFFSMLGDTADYSEWKNNRRATGLVYSAGTFINKTGYGFAGAIVMMVLANYGYEANTPESIPGSVEGMKQLMSLIPAVFGVIAVACVFTYPLTEEKMQEIEAELGKRREAAE